MKIPRCASLSACLQWDKRMSARRCRAVRNGGEQNQTGGIKTTERRVLQRGAGKDVLFLHGYGARKECFLPQINYFSRFCRVTAFDFTGFGDAPPLASPWAVDDYAAETRDVVRSLGLSRPHVVAHSFGARVAVKIAAADEGFFGKMVLTGAAGIVTRRTLG